MILIGHDVDGTLIDFKQPFLSLMHRLGYGDGVPTVAKDWIQYKPDWPHASKGFEHLERDLEFWQNLPLCPSLGGLKPQDLAVDMYVTHLPVHSSHRIYNLARHAFPDRPVYAVKSADEKVDVINKFGITHFLEDRWDSFIGINDNCPDCICYLLKREHNSYERIQSQNADSILYVDSVAEFQAKVLRQSQGPE